MATPKLAPLPPTESWTRVERPKGFESVFVRYKLRMTFLTKLCGGVPNKKELIRPWLDARAPKVRPPDSKSIDEVQEEVVATLAAEAEAEPEFTSNIFQVVAGRIVVRADNVRAHMKDCARTISSKYVGSITGEAAFSSRIIECTYPDKHQEWLTIARPGGTPVLKADDAMEKAVHIRDRQGSRSALKRFEYVKPPCVLEVTLCVIAKPRQARKVTKKDEEAKTVAAARPAVSPDDLYKLFDYGGTHGFGPERGAGEGRYTFELFQEETP
jgi:hypothetical protein